MCVYVLLGDKTRRKLSVIKDTIITNKLLVIKFEMILSKTHHI